MYIPEYQKNENVGEVKSFIRENAFASLVTFHEGRPHATHIPLILEVDDKDRDVLTGHLARANHQWRHFDSQEEVLCIFNGPHAYISSSWYQEEEVPTWDYIAVHVYGRLQIMDESSTMKSLHRLVDLYEQDSEKPVSMKEMSKKTLQQVKGVVGFQIVISDIQARYKLSQGRKEDHGEIINQLNKRDDSGSSAIAKEIKKHSP